MSEQQRQPASLNGAGQYMTPAAALLALAAAVGNYVMDLSGDTQDRITAVEKDVFELRYECDCLTGDSDRD